MTPIAVPRKYWYKNFITACPVCGRGENYRERQYTETPPKRSPERWSFEQAYDWCMEY